MPWGFEFFFLIDVNYQLVIISLKPKTIPLQGTEGSRIESGFTIYPL